MKVTIKTVLCILSILAITLSTSGVPYAKDTFEFKGASATVPSHPLGKAGSYFKEIVEKKSQGRIKIKWYVGGALGGEQAILNQLKDGVVQFATLSTAIAGTLNPKVMTMFTPYFIMDWDNFNNQFLKSKSSKTLLNGLQKFGIQGYNWVPYGFDALAYKGDPIRTFEDCKGRKLRAAESYVIKGTLEALGFNTSPIPWNEAYQSIQQKVVDGLTTPPGMVKMGRFDELVDNLTLSNHLFGTHVFWVKEDTLTKLPDDLKQIFLESIHEACLKEQKEAQGLDEKSVDDMRKKEIKIWTLSKEETKRWVKATSIVYKEHESRIDKFSGDGRAFMQQIFKSLGRDYDREVYGKNLD
jgi:TRAP-type C4-dicarboxylate transport system substrate-binding protein